VQNENQRSQDYGDIKNVFRPSHADYSYEKKYGRRDYRGGGRSSARETIARVIGGAVAQKVLEKKYPDLKIYGFTRSIGTDYFEKIDLNFIEQNSLRMADESSFAMALQKVKTARDDGDSLGGTVEVRVTNPPAGLGSPVFGKLEAELAQAMMSIPAAKGFEVGEGFELAKKLGSEANDPFVTTPFPKRGVSHSEAGDLSIKTKRNANGGILGGISTGDDIWFRVAIKPTSSISKPQTTVNKAGETVDLAIKGRHDPILLPRAVPILEAMTALVILDHVMLHHAQCNL
jgi:chorismate synthase